jgi:hypothetical protein
LAGVLSAALVVGAFPGAALANTPVAAPPQALADPNAGVAMPPPAEVMDRLKSWGAFKSDDDVLKTYLGDANHLTPLGRSLYLSLVRAHDPKLEGRAIAEEVLSLQPAFDKLRDNGVYNATRQAAVERTLETFQRNFGAVKSGDSLEAGYENGALREALMNGASVADAPAKGEMIQVPVKDGYEFWDHQGLAFRSNKNNATTYSRAVQQMQHAMNQSRPPEVAFVPETGRFNGEMFDFRYYLLKNQYDAIFDGMNRERAIALAELLGDAGKYREDLWFTEPRIQKDLEAKARNKMYRDSSGHTVSVWDLVERKFKQREYYLSEALKAVTTYQKDMQALKDELKTTGVIGDSQVDSLGMDEQYARRFLTLGVIETQTFEIKNQMEHLDPSSPDSEQVLKAIDGSDMTPIQKANYKAKARDMVAKLQALLNVLEKSRSALSSANYAGSMDMANASIASGQRQLGLLSTDYSMYVEVPTLGYLGNQQLLDGWSSYVTSWGSKLTRGVWHATNASYARNMDGIEADKPKYASIARLIADGKMAEARQAVIALDPDAIKGAFSVALGGDPAKISDAARLAASLKAGHDRIANVYQTNEYLDTAGRFITWSVEMAVAAPLARRMSEGTVKLLEPFTKTEGVGAYSAWVARPAIFASESLKHLATRLGSLEPDALRVNAIAGENAVARYMVTTALRTGSVAARQASFTLTSGVISGAFTVGQHLWDEASLKVFAPGQSLTTSDLPVVGELGFRPNESAFNSAGDAAWAGFKGGVVWANKPMDVFGIPLLHPGLLGYVGVPSTVFRGTRLASYMEILGSRGVVGSSVGMTKLFFVGENTAAAAGGAAERGFLERMAAGGPIGKAGAFSLSMVDNVAKYAVFSNVVGGIGRAYDYHVNSFNVPGLGNIGGHGDEPDLERRIKFSNQAGDKLYASPLWMMIPTYAAHSIRDAQGAQRAMEGVRQAVESDHQTGTVAEQLRIANTLDPAVELPMLKPPKAPLSQKIFELTLLPAETESKFTVQSEVRRSVIKSILPRLFGAPEGKTDTISPEKYFKLFHSAEVPDQEFMGLKVDATVRSVAEELFLEAVIRDPAGSAKALAARPGEAVEGFGNMRPALRREIATKLFASNKELGPELTRAVKEIMERVGETGEVMVKPSKEVVDALKDAPEKSPNLQAAVSGTHTIIENWMKNPEERPYTKVLEELQAKSDADLAAGRLTPAEHRVMTAINKYMEAIETRFNTFNNVAKAYEQALESLEAVTNRFAGDAAVREIGEELRTTLDAWHNARPKDAVADTGAGGDFEKLISALERKVSNAKLPPEQRAAFADAVAEIKASPWVFRNGKGEALPSWRAVQFESMMSAMGTLATESTAGRPPRFFLMLKTGGGKTLLASLGLLPFLEADAAAVRGKKPKPLYLVPQANLQAQARMEFASFGLRVETDTYEGWKSKVAQGRLTGRDRTLDYTVMGDEGDAATQQPMLTIGAVSGNIPRRSAIFNRIDSIDSNISRRLGTREVQRAAKARSEVGLSIVELDGFDPGGVRQPMVESARTQAADLEAAATRLGDARTVDARAAAEAEVRARAAALDQTLNGIGGDPPVTQARAALKRLIAGLDGATTAKPAKGWGDLWRDLTGRGEAPEAGGRDAILKDVNEDLARQERLLDMVGGEGGLTRLRQEYDSRTSQLDSEQRGLESRQAATQKFLAELKVRQARANTGSAEATNLAAKVAEQRSRLLAIEHELGSIERARRLVSLFSDVDSGLRIVGLQEKLAAADAKPGSATPEQVAAWKSDLAGYYRDWAGADAPSDMLAEGRAHADALTRLYKIQAEAAEVKAAIDAGPADAAQLAALKTRYENLKADQATTRAELGRLKRSITAGSAETGVKPGDADLGGMLRRLDVTAADIAALDAKVVTQRAALRAKGNAATSAETAALRADTARVAELRGERAALLEQTLTVVRQRLKASSDMVTKTIYAGKAGWEVDAADLLAERRAMIEAFAADENPMYGVFREMKDWASGYAQRTRLSTEGGLKTWGETVREEVDALSAKMRAEGKTDAEITAAVDDKRVQMERVAAGDRTANDMVVDELLRDAAGKPLWKVLPKTLKMTWDVFQGREPSAQTIADVGMTRVFSAKLLKAMRGDPTMPVNVRDNMFWNLTSSLLRPGTEHNASWVRAEMMRMYQGHFDDPAKIRFDSLTGRINVVHNGEWYESMDNATRRFWELHYGADLTLPYTNESMSTIKDLTTNRKARFILFSGTVAPTLRGVLEKDNIPVSGKGSNPPPPDQVTELVVPHASDGLETIGHALATQISSRGEVVVDPQAFKGADAEVRAQLEAKAGGDFGGTRVLQLKDFHGPDSAAALRWLTEMHDQRGDAQRVVLSPSRNMPKLSDGESALLRGQLDSGAVPAGPAREALRKVLALEPVTPEERAALEGVMKGWKTEPLAAARESVDVQLSANVPTEVRRAVNEMLAANRWVGKDKVVVDIPSLKGATPAETKVIQDWLMGLRAKQGDTGIVFVVVPDTRQLKDVIKILKKQYGLSDAEITKVFSDTTKLADTRPEARVLEQMNQAGLKTIKTPDGVKARTTKVVIGDARTFARGLDLALKEYTTFEMVVLDRNAMDNSDEIQAAGRIDPDRILPGASREFKMVINVDTVRNLSVFRDMVKNDIFFSKQLRGDPAFVEFVKAHGDGRSPDFDLSLYNDYIDARAADGSFEGSELAETYREKVLTALKAQQSEIEAAKLASSGVRPETSQTGGQYPAVERAR